MHTILVCIVEALPLLICNCYNPFWCLLYIIVVRYGACKAQVQLLMAGTLGLTASGPSLPQACLWPEFLETTQHVAHRLLPLQWWQ